MAEDYENLREWGQNIIRWGVMWPGVAPTSGGVNETYLSVMRNVTDTVSEGYGIWSLIDAHQDVLAAPFCGEGAPTWAVWTGAASGAERGFPWPADAPYAVDNATGAPSPADCAKHDWTDYYFTWAQGAAAQALYNNSGGVRDAFAASWAAVAGAFSGAPGVVGWELLNEPWAGDAIGDVGLMVFGVADRANLQPFYDVLAAAIAGADPAGHIVLFESVTWDDVFPVGFDKTPGNFSATALSFHYYNPPNLNAASQFAARSADMKRLNCGGMLTEFDISGANVAGMQETMAVADAYLGSWIGWEYKTFVEITGYGWGPYNPDGSVNDAVVKGARVSGLLCVCVCVCVCGWVCVCVRARSEGHTRSRAALARTYPAAVAGMTHAFTFDNATGAFNLTYALGAAATGATEVFVSLKYYYPAGITVTAVPSGVVSWVFAPITRGAPHPVSTPGQPAARPAAGAVGFERSLARAAAGGANAGYIVVSQLPAARVGQVVQLSVVASA